MNAADAFDRARNALLCELNSAGHWTGELSGSALSTAVATIALGKSGHAEFVEPGLKWLAANVNADGGWGDTIRSQSNLSTTALVWAAFGSARRDADFPELIARAERWLWRAAGSRENLPEAIAERYGKDRTFSVPILMTLALSGRLGADGWRRVMPLPFELAAAPRSWFGALQLPVVSYALPALIAIGQAIHHHAPSRNPLARGLRNAVRGRTLRSLEALQPPNGGFLEATPLTAFVTMSLASFGHENHVVARRGAAFLRESMRPDGSWPIDTNLATWVTTLAVKALATQPDALSAAQRKRIRDWLLAQQFRETHPYTGAAPGGWAWTPLPGGVPDADDTAGALLALHHLGAATDETLRAVERGVEWLLNLQNRDGGIPTFCRGWGALPFDRSSPELTAHALRAWAVWEGRLAPAPRHRVRRAAERAFEYLRNSQREDGAWIPLWFGNENTLGQENAVYGTAQTLVAVRDVEMFEPPWREPMIQRGGAFLEQAQLPSGGWGGDGNGPESLEETAQAVEALVSCGRASKALDLGVARLVDMVGSGGWDRPAAIGLYFARLWYFEKLYPKIFATAALGRIVSRERMNPAAHSSRETAR